VRLVASTCPQGCSVEAQGVNEEKVASGHYVKSHQCHGSNPMKSEALCEEENAEAQIHHERNTGSAYTSSDVECPAEEQKPGMLDITKIAPTTRRHPQFMGRTQAAIN
jgi:hypothetical protein